MPDVTGFRAKFAAIIPSTNTVVEHDLNAMRPPGVTVHAGRMYIERPELGSDELFTELLGQIRQSIAVAIRDVLTCAPDHLVMGMSAETFWNGVEGNSDFERRVGEMSGGLGVSTGASSCRAGLTALGVRRIAVLSPYQPIADRMVTQFFTEAGFDVVGFHGLRCPTALAIAEVLEADLIRALRGLDGPDVEAIVQVGTNLSMVRLADEAERWMGKPILAINATTLWHALRTNTIKDQIPGYGTLLRSY